MKKIDNPDMKNNLNITSDIISHNDNLNDNVINNKIISDNCPDINAER